MFEENYLKSAAIRRSRSPILVSFVVHLIAGGVLVAVPLIWHQSLVAGHLVTFLMPPPPKVGPPPPPPPPQLEMAPQRIVSSVQAKELFVPPSTLDPPDEETLPSGSWITSTLPQAGTTGGIPGPGGTVGSLSGMGPGVSVTTVVPPPPPPPVRREPIRVSSGAQGARLIHRVEPIYPPLAIAARQQGLVVIQATITEKGDVESVRVIQGPTLLREAAVDAVRQWKYEPTLLNGEPVAVIATVAVNFRLRR